MPYARPTLTELVTRIGDDVDGRLPGADSRLRRSVLSVLVRVLGGALFGLYGLLDWVWRQVFPDTADGEQLARWAAIWGVNRKASIAATGAVAITGTNGAVVPIGAELVRADAVTYRAIAAATIIAGTATLAIEAVDAGNGGNATSGTRLTFSSPVVGINAGATVTVAGIVGGAGEEDDADLRSRLLSRIQRPPHGGNRDDYIAWAREVPEVTRAWLSAGELGPGTVTVRFVMDGRADIIPAAPDVAAVAAYIEALRPVTAAVTVVAPVAASIDFAIRAIPPSVAVQNAITEQLRDLLSREAEPGGTIPISRIREAISLAAGEMDHEVIAPNGNVTLPTGHIAIIGDVDFV